MWDQDLLQNKNREVEQIFVNFDFYTAFYLILFFLFVFLCFAFLSN